MKSPEITDAINELTSGRARRDFSNLLGLIQIGERSE
jgi:hypothetical protein